MDRLVIDPSTETAPILSLFGAEEGRLFPCDKATWLRLHPVGGAFVLVHRWTVARPELATPIWRLWRCDGCEATWNETPGQGDCENCGGAIVMLRQGRMQRVRTVHVAFRGGHCDLCGRTLYVHRVIGEAETKPLPTRCRKHGVGREVESRQPGQRTRARLAATADTDREPRAPVAKFETAPHVSELSDQQREWRPRESEIADGRSALTETSRAEELASLIGTELRRPF